MLFLVHSFHLKHSKAQHKQQSIHFHGNDYFTAKMWERFAFVVVVVFSCFFFLFLCVSLIHWKLRWPTTRFPFQIEKIKREKGKKPTKWKSFNGTIFTLAWILRLRLRSVQSFWNVYTHKMTNPVAQPVPHLALYLLIKQISSMETKCENFIRKTFIPIERIMKKERKKINKLTWVE